MDSLRETFNSAAARYHRARPGYPDELFDDLIALTGIDPNSRILEVGPGTGKATLSLARRGFSILGVELGADLAEEARHNLAAFPDVSIEVGEFETHPIDVSGYDLVMSATAFHWIRQPVGYQRVAAALRPGGYFAEFRHHHVWSAESDQFVRESQKVYLQYGPRISPNFRLPLPEEVPTREDDILETGLFEGVITKRYRQDVIHTPESFRELLLTFSDHIAQPEPTRSNLVNGIAEVIRGLLGDRAIKTHHIVLHIARLPAV